MDGDGEDLEDKHTFSGSLARSIARPCKVKRGEEKINGGKEDRCIDRYRERQRERERATERERVRDRERGERVSTSFTWSCKVKRIEGKNQRRET